MHAFGPGESSGAGQLVWLGNGSLLGLTGSGGTSDGGTVFRYDASGGITTVYNFGGSDFFGSNPAQLVRAQNGSIYGVNQAGGLLQGGTAWRMGADGSNPALLYSFFASSDWSSSHGWSPVLLVQSSSGDFYGATDAGGGCGSQDGCGTLFRLH